MILDFSNYAVRSHS